MLGVVSSILLNSTAFAGEWLKISDSLWLYAQENNEIDFKERWQWIDSNNDGMAECYYFDPEGFLLINGTTPDGYTVNSDGKWIVNGGIQSKPLSEIANKITYLNSNPNNQTSNENTETSATEEEMRLNKYNESDAEFKTLKEGLLKDLEYQISMKTFGPQDPELKTTYVVCEDIVFNSENATEKNRIMDKAYTAALQLWQYLWTAYGWEVEEMYTHTYISSSSVTDNAVNVGLEITLK